MKEADWPEGGCFLGFGGFLCLGEGSGRESLLCIFLKSRPGHERRGEGWCNSVSVLIC